MWAVTRGLCRKTLLAGIAVISTVAFGVPTASADPIDDQRQKISRITDELERLEERSDILAEDHVSAVNEQQRLDAEVVAAEARVAELVTQVEALRGELSQVAVQTYMGAGTNGFGPLFADSGAVTDTLARDQLSRVALSAGTATTDELDEAVAELAEQQAVLERTRDEAVAQAARIEEAKKANESSKSEYDRARRDAEAELGDLVQKEEERRARESYERTQRQAEEAAARAAADAQQAQVAEQARTAQEVQATRQPPTPGVEPEAASPAPSAVAAPRSAPARNDQQSPTIPAASSRAGTAINAAKTQLGVPWIFAKAEPGVGFDCSGLTSWAWAQAGISLPHQSRAQFAMLPQIPASEAQPGDLLFYYSPISHVGIYLGGGQLIHSPNSGSVVNIATVNWSKVTGVGRPG